MGLHITISICCIYTQASIPLKPQLSSTEGNLFFFFFVKHDQCLVLTSGAMWNTIEYFRSSSPTLTDFPWKTAWKSSRKNSMYQIFSSHHILITCKTWRKCIMTPSYDSFHAEHVTMRCTLCSSIIFASYFLYMLYTVRRNHLKLLSVFFKCIKI